MGVTYASQVRARREALHLTQRELAALSGVKQPLISAIESGRRQPSAATRTALDRVLVVRPSQVLREMRGQALEIVARHHGSAPRVFGSVARGTDGPDSDVDLLVTFPEDAGITDLLAMEDELTELLTVRVEVVSAGSGGRVIDRAVREAIPL